MRFERNWDQRRRLQPLADIPYADSTRNRLDRGSLKGVEYSEEGWYQVPDMELAELRQNTGRKTMCCSSCELTNMTITWRKRNVASAQASTLSGVWAATARRTLYLSGIQKDPARPNIQKTCTFKELVYETVRVAGCAHHADSLYTYPVATERRYGKCDSASSDCTV
ncbi:hypothetical protein MC885_018667 [Smutsia gigantea]|nr:hypothetical protein MC885_018667 [Smutsia gigantea]